MNLIAEQIITAAGGAQTITMPDPNASLYVFNFLSVGSASPAAGTTAVSVVPAYGTSEPVIDINGANLNIDPTALRSFKLSYPIKSITFTPSSWTANSAIKVSVVSDSEMQPLDL